MLPRFQLENFMSKPWASLVLTAVATCPSLAQAVVVIPGPTVDVGTGIREPLSYRTTVNRAGVAIGQLRTATSSQSTTGYYPLRWDGRSGEVLQSLGTASNGKPRSMPVAINSASVAVGSVYKYSPTHQNLGEVPTRWDADSGIAIELLSQLTPTSLAAGRASAINAAGLTVGRVFPGEFTQFSLAQRPVLWNAQGELSELNTLGQSSTGLRNGAAVVVNNAGVVAGWSDAYDANGTLLGRKVVRWNPGSVTPIALGWGSGAEIELPMAINDSGVIVANSVLLGGYAPMRWAADGTMTELRTFGVASTGQRAEAAVYSLNAAGDAVGYSEKTVNGRSAGNRAVRWNADSGNVIELAQRFPGSTNSAAANGINRSGIAVGIDTAQAVIWDSENVVRTLASFLPANSSWIFLRSALTITDTGWIAGDGVFDPTGGASSDAYARHFTMLVPEAGTYGRGDANFDTLTDFADLVILAQKYNLANPTQATTVADFDLNGVTDFQDLVILAQNYNAGGANIAGLGSSDFAADWALAQSLVPEPTGIVAIGLIATAVRRRRG